MHDMKEKLSLLWIFAPSRPSKPERPAPEWGRRQPARAFQACVPGGRPIHGLYAIGRPT